MASDVRLRDRRMAFRVRLAAAAGLMVGVAGMGSLAWGGFIPGGGSDRSDCYTQLYVAGIDSPGPQVRRERIVSCTDGDPCDLGRGALPFPYGGGPGCGNNRCEFLVAFCVGQTNPALPACTPSPLRFTQLHVRRLGVPGRDFEPDYIPRRSLLNTAFPWEKRSGPSCGSPIGMTVEGRVTKDGRKFPGRLEISVAAVALGGASPARDRDTFILECLPRTTPCPDEPPPTTTTLPPITTGPTVIVGAGGGLRFDPDTVRIRAGDTVRWVWEGSGADLVSYSGLFCYPGCDSHPADDRVLTGTVFEHTFPDPGTFGYESTWAFPMDGRVIVEP
jgi:plastocyanin